jgi:hypothetical protein
VHDIVNTPIVSEALPVGQFVGVSDGLFDEHYEGHNDERDIGQSARVNAT